MISVEDEETKFSSVLGLDVTQTAQIPKDIQRVLLERFTKGSENDETSANNKVKELETEIEALKAKLAASKTGDSELNSSGQNQNNVDLDSASFPTQDIEVDLPKAVETALDLPTATDALASEAAFMENIGLYLKPRQSLTKGPTFLRERTSSDCLEAADILMWCDQNTANEMPNLSDSPAKSKPQSLLSFLHKSKLSSNDETERPTVGISDQHSSGKWRLWNPEQENPLSQEDELWNDIVFSSAAEYIENETTDTPELDEMTKQTSSTGETIVVSNPTSKSTTLDLAEFSCKPCGRVLGSKEALYRHKLSELHFKRESMAMDGKNTTPEVSKKTSPKSPIKVSISSMTDVEPKSSKIVSKHNTKVSNSCSSCNANVPTGCFGKHLVSHFHHYHLKSRELHNELILEHIHEIVKQAPFQCHICRFYCNFEEQFIHHWKSKHISKMCSGDKNENVGYWCSACRIISSSEEAMVTHLISERHLEIGALINRNIAIVIKKVKLSECQICLKKFRLKFSLDQHMKKNHPGTKKLENIIQESEDFICCNLCTYKTLEVSKMKQHKFMAHTNRDKKSFSCQLCSKVFASKYAALNHKNSKEHIERFASTHSGAFDTCHLCGENIKDSIEDHFIHQHFDDLLQCCICGTFFISAQKLGAHIRGTCVVTPNAHKSKFDGFACDKCCFVGKSDQLRQLHILVAHSNSEDLNWKCPRCNEDPDGKKKIFSSRSKLHRHLLTHQDKEHQNRCPKCCALFQSTLAEITHNCTASRQRVLIFHCPMCQYNCNKAVALKSHMLTHQPQKTPGFFCPHCDNFNCTRRSELSRHIERKHKGANGKKIKCQFCPYTTFSRQHLDRHLAGAHESGGGKNNQYFCRKCSFSCNSMDNLRKHILKTTKHPESHVYDCHLCSFKNNSRLDFKNHLIRIHPNEKANIVVDEYFKQHNGTIKSQNN